MTAIQLNYPSHSDCTPELFLLVGFQSCGGNKTQRKGIRFLPQPYNVAPRASVVCGFGTNVPACETQFVGDPLPTTAAPDSLTTDIPGKDLAPPNNSQASQVAS